MRGTTYTTQIRMSEELHDRVMRIAAETGDSMNGTLLHMIAMGVKFYEAPFTLAPLRLEQEPARAGLHTDGRLER